MWEALGIFLWWLTRTMKGVNSTKYVVLQWTGSHYRKIAERFVKNGQKTWGRKKGRMNQPDAVVYTESGFLSDHGVVFTDDKHTLPMQVKMTVLPHNPTGKGREYSVNPNVEDMEDSTGRGFVRQIVRSNSVGAIGLSAIVILVVGAVGFALGVLGGPYVLPQHFPPATVTTVTSVAHP